MRQLKLLLPLALLFSGCTKHDTTPDTPCYPLSLSPWRIAEESVFEGPDTTLVQKLVFRYDSAGRLTLILVDEGGRLDTTETYSYYADSVVMNFATFLLNKQGLATFIPGLMTWEYNSDGYCTRETYSNTDSSFFLTNEFTWSCFNRSQERDRTNNGVPVITNFRYYNKVNTIGNENHGKSFLGRQNNALLQYGIREGDTKFTKTYIFDSLNRVIWETHNEKTGYVYYVRYTYL